MKTLYIIWLHTSEMYVIMLVAVVSLHSKTLDFYSYIYWNKNLVRYHKGFRRMVKSNATVTLSYIPNLIHYSFTLLTKCHLGTNTRVSLLWVSPYIASHVHKSFYNQDHCEMGFKVLNTEKLIGFKNLPLCTRTFISGAAE